MPVFNQKEPECIGSKNLSVGGTLAKNVMIMLEPIDHILKYKVFSNEFLYQSFLWIFTRHLFLGRIPFWNLGLVAKPLVSRVPWQ